MIDSPERIWAYAVSDGVVTDYNWTDTPNSGTEYIRADIAASQLAGIHELYGFEQRGRLAAEAERDRLAAVLTEIAGDIDGTWDEKFRAVQSIARAALAGKE